MKSQIFNKDCLDVLPTIPDNSIDCVVTDCPYTIVSGGCTTKNSKCAGVLSGNSNDTKSGKLFKHNDIKFSDWLPHVYRVLKDGTHCYIMINGRNLSELQLEAEKVGFEFQNLLVWSKGNVTPNRYYMGAVEFILMLRKGKARTINNAGSSNLISVKNPTGRKNHPTQKPIELMEVFITNSTNEGDIVLDPFMGTGATCLASMRSKRRFVGIEIDKEYATIALKYLKELRDDKVRTALHGKQE